MCGGDEAELEVLASDALKIDPQYNTAGTACRTCIGLYFD
jgi:hypothetical protein